MTICRILRWKKLIDRDPTERFGLDITEGEVLRRPQYDGRVAYESTRGNDDLVVEYGIGKQPSQFARSAPNAVEQSEQPRFAAPQLPFILEEITGRKPFDLMSRHGLSKGIESEPKRVVNDRVVHPVLEPPKRI